MGCPGTEKGSKRTLTRRQFSEAITKLRRHTLTGKKQQNKAALDPRSISANEEDFLNCNNALIDVLFSEKEKIVATDFIAIKFSLQKSLYHYEFYQFEVDENNTISAAEFAKSFLSTISFTKTNTYLKRIQSIDLKGRVSLREFIAFQRFIEKADIIKMKIATYRYLDFNMLRDLVDDFESIDPYCCEKECHISDVQLETMIKVLDLDDSETLDYEEVFGVLDGRKNLGVGKEEEFKNDIKEMVSSILKKFKRMIGY